MFVLAIDSSGASCGVCVWQDGKIVASMREPMARGQDARLLPMILDVMKKASCTFEDLNRIAITKGPGSFTGVRVGLAAACGLGLAANIPVIGIDRFAAYEAFYKKQNKNILVVIDSKRVELFCRFYPINETAHAPNLWTELQIKAFLADHPDTLVVGDLATPLDDVLGMCAALAAEADPTHPDFLPRPLYLRAPDVTVSSR